MNRRGFLGAILATATPPAFVRFGSLMVPVPRKIEVEELMYYEDTIIIDQMRHLHLTKKHLDGIMQELRRVAVQPSEEGFYTFYRRAT